MADEPGALTWLTGTMEAVRESLKMTAECLAATSALIQAVSEQFPEMSARYEVLRAASLENAPHVRIALQQAALCDQIIQGLKGARDRGDL